MTPTLFFQKKDLNLSKFNGMALGLKGYGTFVQHLVTIDDQFLGVSVVFVKLRLLIFQHDLTVNDVLDGRVAVDLNFAVTHWSP